MKKFILGGILLLCFSCAREAIPYGTTTTLDENVLLDKIKGGWFAQTIGCTYGTPTEFYFRGGFLPDGEKILWNDNAIADLFHETPGMYDDVYMDLTFLEVMLSEGKDAPASAYAESYAHAPYNLWHANQAGRYNILNGIEPPMSGYWENNPHADDIDFQIESDFIGMLFPGRPGDAAVLADRIGHIMNYGDGWYGGVFIGAMYSLAYVCDDIPTIVSEASKIIPEGTKFRSCIDDVIYFHNKYPDDWKRCWFEIEKRHGDDIGCPNGVWNGINIEARINSAYVVIGLLYGEDDFEKTMEIATRCGQDSDCNPASAAGIWGVVHGFNAIPEYYRKAAELIADEPFPYTTLSLNAVSQKNLELMDLVDGKLAFEIQRPEPVRYEQSFEGLTPVLRTVLRKRLTDELEYEFDGNSIVVCGSVTRTAPGSPDDVARILAYIDGEFVGERLMPINYLTRSLEVFHKYGFASGHHKLTLKIANPEAHLAVNIAEVVAYN